jgi:hypothetical protein
LALKVQTEMAPRKSTLATPHRVTAFRMGLSYLSPYWSWANSGELVSCRDISIGPVPPHEPLKLVWCAVSGPIQLGTELDSGGELSYPVP